MKIWLNGTVIDARNVSLEVFRRGFQYGDGVFETMLFYKGRCKLFSYHMKRLKLALLELGIDFILPLEDTFELEYQKLAAENTLRTDFCRVRFTVWRSGSGLYQPDSDTGSAMMEVFPLNEPEIQYEDIMVLKEIRKSTNNSAFYKSLSSEFYVKAGLALKKYSTHECVLINEMNRVSEGLYSNIFLLKDGIWLTPPLEEGCIAGVFRQYLLDSDSSVVESVLTMQDLMDAEEIFFTNAVRGIQLIKSIDGKEIKTEEGNKKATVQKPW